MLEYANIKIIVSLSFADLLVLLTAVPEAIISHHVGKRWLFGSAGCAVFVFLNFLGINVGSLSIMTFTVERYIAICRPLLAYRVCTVERTKKIIFWGWIIVVAYCCPWFALTEVKTDNHYKDRQQCQFRMSKEQYSAFFIADFAIFYLVPLLTAFVSYVYIGNAVRKRQNSATSRGGSMRVSIQLETEQQPLRYRHSTSAGSVSIYRHSSRGAHPWPQKQNNSVNRMLIVVVILFAVSWLPFRLLLIYNSFVSRSWLDIWFLLFAKSLVYLNCAINPILYNIMSQRFRRAVRQTLFSCWPGFEFRRQSIRDRSSTATLPSVVQLKVETVITGKFHEDDYFVPRVAV
ncbi:thyrotropin-releasing hormone receptor-like isoform X2 [Paramacrobiotus metropolitanus]|uniref:thyrotropin-releasing hormone receptor-like isoform X2 n=1 Tax=Paramacrobiotus metropolitanus TaxID=2943436 RepID=UPI0024459D1B|nr:thyrotropin-releasing hormone receptor-like isoform X2 [Paramacrobiotus metropolitanus]